MLILSRRINESLWIGDTEVRVVDCKNGRVHLGITAPNHIPVHRDEIKNRLAHPVSFAKQKEKTHEIRH